MSTKLPKAVTAAQLAALTGGVAEGAVDRPLTGIAVLTDAGAEDISFLGNPKYGEAAALSNAGCLLLPPSARTLPARAPARVYVDDPQGAFAKLLVVVENAKRAKILPGLSPKATLHYQAKLGAGVLLSDFVVIERGAVIGENTIIMPHVWIGHDARIGSNCLLYPGVVVREECVIGDRAVIHSGAVIGSDGFGFVTDRKTGKHTKIPQLGNVVIKDDVEIGANVTIDRATLGSTIVESGTKIDNLVQLGHNVKLGRDCLVISQTGIAGSTTVGSNVILAGQAGVAGHLTIGDGSIIAAPTGVMSDVPPKTTLFGSPGRPHREAFKLQALFGRLPELFDKLKELEKKLGTTAGQ